MTEHKRREGYWKYYEMARRTESDFVRQAVLQLIRDNPHPARTKETNRGRRPAHSSEKMDFLCIMKVVKNVSFRDIGDELGSMHGAWDGEPRPDHSWVTRHMQTIDIDWLDTILVETASLCLTELEKSGGDPALDPNKEVTVTHESADISGRGPTAPLGADSSGVETDRYEDAEVPSPKQQDFVETRTKTYLKYHITAITGHQIVIGAYVTASNVSDMVMLPEMIEQIPRNYPQLVGRIVNADRGYDSDHNCEKTFESGMIPNIKQRRPASGSTRTNRGRPSRRKAAKIYDPQMYKQRSLIEGIFGAEETKNHRLYCRMRLDENRKRFGKIMAIAWNIRTLNKFICAHKKGQKIPSYG